MNISLIIIYAHGMPYKKFNENTEMVFSTEDRAFVNSLYMVKGCGGLWKTFLGKIRKVQIGLNLLQTYVAYLRMILYIFVHHCKCIWG